MSKMQYPSILVLFSICVLTHGVTEATDDTCGVCNQLQNQQQSLGTILQQQYNQSSLIKDLGQKVNDAKNRNEALMTTMIIQMSNIMTEITNVRNGIDDKTDCTQNQRLVEEIARLESKAWSMNTSIAEMKNKIQQLIQDNNKLNDSLQGCSQEHPSPHPPTPQITEQPPPSGNWISGGHRINNTFSNVLSKVKNWWQKTEVYETSSSAHRMTVVNDKLWLSMWNDNHIKVIDPYTAQPYQIITHRNMRGQIDIKQISPHHMLISSNSYSTGLYVSDVNGTYLYQITKGVFYGITTKSNLAYAYKHTSSGSGEIVTLHYTGQRWAIKNVFPVHGSSWTTLEVVDDTLYVCSRSSDTIYTYNLTGTYLTAHGNRGNHLGQLSQPFLCGVDNAGSVLICEDGNNRFQVLAKNGTWLSEVEPLGVSNPVDVIIDVQGSVWVLHYYGKFRIMKYSDY